MKESADILIFEPYLWGLEDDVKQRMQTIAGIVLKLLPDACPITKYKMPGFEWRGSNLIHFNAYAKHIGIYPVPMNAEEISESLRMQVKGKGTLQLNHRQPLSEELIKEVVLFNKNRISQKNK